MQEPIDFAKVFQSAPEPCAVLDATGTYRAANRVYLRRLGEALEHVEGRAVVDVPPFSHSAEDAERIRTSLVKVVATGEPDRVRMLDCVLLDENGGGTEHCWSLAHIPVSNADGSVQFILQIPYASLHADPHGKLDGTQAAGASSWSLDLAHGEIQLDNGARDTLLASRQEFPKLAATLELRIPPDESEQAKPFDASATAGSSAATAPRWLEGDGRATFGAARHSVRLIGALLQATQQAGRPPEYERLAQELDALDDFAALVSLKGEVQTLNAAGRRMIAMDNVHDSGRGQPFVSLFAERERARVTNEAIPSSLHDGMWEGELLLQDVFAGVEVPILCSVFVLRTGGGRAPMLAVFGRDLRRHRAEEAERVELLRNERIARAEAETANRLKDEFLAAVSHELRTPLTAILGFLHLLRGNRLPSEKRERALEIIERNARSQAQVIEDLLDVGRMVSGKLVIEKEVVDVGGVVLSAVDSTRPLADKKGVSLEAYLACQHCTVMGDARRLEQVVWNLLSNAVKFTPAGGSIRVTVHQEHNGLAIHVQDTGIGFDAEFISVIFERFRQVDGGLARRKGGLGLGLSIVRALVDAHGGTVTAQSEGANCGSEFIVRLPSLVTEHALKPERPSMRPASNKMPMLDGWHVLVVDDARDTREYLKTLLEHAGARVYEASNAQEALHVLRDKHPDVLLTNIGLGHTNGYALLRRVRALPESEGGKTPAIAVTAHARDEDRQRAMQAGFQKYVTKPVLPDVLFAAVRSLVATRTG